MVPCAALGGSHPVPGREGLIVVLHKCCTCAMSTKKPRIHAVLEDSLFQLVKRLAEQEGLSLSEQASELIREAAELREDRALDAFAEKRRRTFSPGKALSVSTLRRRAKTR